MAINIKSYFNELKYFMKFLGKTNMSDNEKFPDEELLMIKPNDICRYFNLKSYGTENPTEHDLPIKARSNTLKSCKKKISFFMPRKNTVWDEVRGEGNPTRSISVNNLIKRVMKFEVCHQGLESKERRPIEYDEFINVLSITRKSQKYSINIPYRLGSSLTLQWHLV